MKQYYYLSLEGKFVIIAAQQDTDRVGLIGASFTAETRAAEYAEQLNDEEEQEAHRIAIGEADNDTEG